MLSSGISATGIERMEPPCWWIGMKHQELQIMVYGENIGVSDLKLAPCPGVKIERVVKADSPNYMFIYLNIGKTARPGRLQFIFSFKGENLIKYYDLLPRETSPGAQGFSPADVLYLIMPDRFANGNKNNDNWGEDTIDRKDSFARHGGDFAGIAVHLDYISDLGVTAVWLNPVLENKMPENKYRSYHGYATTDYYKTDRRLGNNEDYRNLVAELHKRGMKMVMDMIFNHCGSYHWWMKDLPFKDWLNHQEGFVPTTHNSFTIADIHAPESEKRAMTDGWFVESMPDLNQRNPFLADYLIQNSIWWIEYARIDGIRHDTHAYADFDFLARWCKRVQDEYPRFNIVGESWFTVPWWQNNSKVNPRETNLKTVMDFDLMMACAEAFPADTSSDFRLRKIYEVITKDYLYSDWRDILIFLDNHDLSRFCKEGEPNLDRYKQAIAFLLTTRGIPQLYYGTEILMSGEKSEGDGSLRKDFPGGWEDDSLNAFTREGRRSLENEAYDFLRTLLHWRKGSKAVTEGELIHYAPEDYNSTQCYVYARIKGSEKVLVILNGSKTPQTLSFDKYREVLGGSMEGKDIITGTTIPLKDKISIPEKGIYIIEIK
jgi:glycosidase